MSIFINACINEIRKRLPIDRYTLCGHLPSRNCVCVYCAVHRKRNARNGFLDVFGIPQAVDVHNPQPCIIFHSGRVSNHPPSWETVIIQRDFPVSAFCAYDSFGGILHGFGKAGIFPFYLLHNRAFHDILLVLRRIASRIRHHSALYAQFLFHNVHGECAGWAGHICNVQYVTCFRRGVSPPLHLTRHHCLVPNFLKNSSRHSFGNIRVCSRNSNTRPDRDGVFFRSRDKALYGKRGICGFAKSSLILHLRPNRNTIRVPAEF